VKVAIVTTRHGAHDDRIYFKQALSLAKILDVVMIAPDGQESLERESGIVFRPIPRRRGMFGRMRSIFEAIREVRCQDPDFCHLHDLDLALGIPWVRLLTRAKIVYDSHEVFTAQDISMNARFPRSVGRVIGWAIQCVETRLVNLADHIITSVDPKGFAFQNSKVPLTTVFNYPPLQVFDVDQHKLIKETRRYEGRLPIIYQGSMSEERGLFHMLDALSMIKDSESGVLLRLVGLNEGDLRWKAEGRIHELGLAKNVEISGWLPHEEIAVAMKTSRVGLVPLQPNPKYESSLPVKLLEYMACGLPVIAGRFGLIKEYVESSRAGLLYDSTRPDELARCVLELVADPDRCRRMGENGRRAVEERWNWSQMETKLFKIYESLGARIHEGEA